MKCDKAKEYIYLKREIELSQIEKEELDAHIADCNSCKEEFQRAEGYFSTISRIRLPEEILIYHPVTNSVVEAIRPGKVSSLIGLIEKIIYRQTFRFAVAATILIICTFFITEEFRAVGNINNLEKQFSTASIMQTKASSGYLLPLDFLNHYLTGENDYIKLPGKWILMKESELADRTLNLSKEELSSIPDDYKNKLQLLLNHPAVKKAIEENKELSVIYDQLISKER